MPWEGDRLVAVAFSVAKLHSFSLEDVKFLQAQGFPLPSDVAPCSSIHPPLDSSSPLVAGLERLEKRIAGKPLKDLVFLEVFAGSAGLTAAVRRLGLPLARGLDRTVGRRFHAPVTVLDLTRSESQQIVFSMLQAGEVVACHLAPPCGTASKARDINNGGPPPMRSSEEPDGLVGLDASLVPRLQAANTLYLFCAKVVCVADKVGILVSVENPAGSCMWKSCSSVPLLRILLHHCMFGSRRKKHTALACNFPAARALAVVCSGDHEHEPWGRLPGGTWATAAECAYPPALCVALAQAFVDQLRCVGAPPEGRSLDTA